MRKFIFFGGKGGVDKTTMSGAYTAECARNGVRTLLALADPVHNTSDAFDQSFTDEPAAVAGEPNLDAMEIDPETEVREHLMEIKWAMGDQVNPAMINEVDRQIEMTRQTPSVYESALFDRFIDVMRPADEYDRVVSDALPTGGMLRPLSLPEHLDGWIQRLSHERKEPVKLFGRAAIDNNEPRRMVDGDPIIARFEQRRDNFSFVRETLRDDAVFSLVVNPDKLSLRETGRAIDQLGDYGLDVHGLAINRLTSEPDPEESGRGVTFLRERVRTEREHFDGLRESFSPPLVTAVEIRVAGVEDSFPGEVAAELDIDTASDTQ